MRIKTKKMRLRLYAPNKIMNMKCETKIKRLYIKYLLTHDKKPSWPNAIVALF